MISIHGLKQCIDLQMKYYWLIFCCYIIVLVRSLEWVPFQLRVWLTTRIKIHPFTPTSEAINKEFCEKEWAQLNELFRLLNKQLQHNINSIKKEL